MSANVSVCECVLFVGIFQFIGCNGFIGLPDALGLFLYVSVSSFFMCGMWCGQFSGATVNDSRNVDGTCFCFSMKFVNSCRRYRHGFMAGCRRIRCSTCLLSCYLTRHVHNHAHRQNIHAHAHALMHARTRAVHAAEHPASMTTHVHGSLLFQDSSKQ